MDTKVEHPPAGPGEAPAYEPDDTPAAAKSYAAGFEPKAAVPYAWVLAHAYRAVEDLRETADALDRKAERLGGVTLALLALGFPFFTRLAAEGHAHLALAALPAGAAALAALIATLIAHCPRAQRSWPSPKMAIQYAEGDFAPDAEAAAGAFAAKLHETWALQLAVIPLKARALAWAYGLAGLAVASLLIPLRFAIW